MNLLFPKYFSHFWFSVHPSPFPPRRTRASASRSTRYDFFFFLFFSHFISMSVVVLSLLFGVWFESGLCLTHVRPPAFVALHLFVEFPERLSLVSWPNQTFLNNFISFLGFSVVTKRTGLKWILGMGSTYHIILLMLLMITWICCDMRFHCLVGLIEWWELGGLVDLIRWAWFGSVDRFGKIACG